MNSTLLKSGMAAKASPNEAESAKNFANRVNALPNEGGGRSLPAALARVRFAERKYENGELLVSAREGSEFYIGVKSGVLVASRNREGFGREIIGFFFAGDLVGPTSLCDAWPYDLEARGDLRVEFFDLMPRRDFSLSELKTLTEMLAGAYGRAVDLALRERELRSLSVEGRLANFLAHVSGRLGQRSSQGWELILPMTRAEIASYLALRTETVSRIMARWRREGLLELEGRSRILIKDRAALTGMSWEANVRNSL